MSSFLRKIHDITLERVAAARRETPAERLEDAPLFSRPPRDARAAFLRDGYNVIAEIKYASPSQGVIREGGDDAARIAAGYLAAGARMLSVLTEPLYFKGSLDYLENIRHAHPDALLLRKDFVADPYQLLEARARGADAVLLIVAMTAPEVTKDLFHEARALGLTPLVEVHDGRELDEALEIGADFIGVNNRNLKTLEIDLGIGRALAARKPEGAAFICESGLSTAEDLRDMRGRGYDGFLMGTHFMRRPDPGQALAEMLSCA